MTLAQLVFWCGAGQLCVLIASAIVPFRLDWKHEFQSLSRLHRQMYWVYGGYVVLSIVAFGLISLTQSAEIAGQSGLARAFALYVTVFWGVRLSLQTVLDAKPFLTNWLLKAGYHFLTVLFATFTAVYGWTALAP